MEKPTLGRGNWVLGIEVLGAERNTSIPNSPYLLGKNTSAIMQRTLPPPRVSMVGISE